MTSHCRHSNPGAAMTKIGITALPKAKLLLIPDRSSGQDGVPRRRIVRHVRPHLPPLHPLPNAGLGRIPHPLAVHHPHRPSDLVVRRIAHLRRWVPAPVRELRRTADQPHLAGGQRLHGRPDGAPAQRGGGTASPLRGGHAAHPRCCWCCWCW